MSHVACCMSHVIMLHGHFQFQFQKSKMKMNDENKSKQQAVSFSSKFFDIDLNDSVSRGATLDLDRRRLATVIDS